MYDMAFSQEVNFELQQSLLRILLLLLLVVRQLDHLEPTPPISCPIKLPTSHKEGVRSLCLEYVVPLQADVVYIVQSPEVGFAG